VHLVFFYYKNSEISHDFPQRLKENSGHIPPLPSHYFPLRVVYKEQFLPLVKKKVVKLARKLNVNPVCRTDV